VADATGSPLRAAAFTGSQVSRICDSDHMDRMRDGNFEFENDKRNSNLQAQL
jgi:hypothetical protein